jgi:hypothetical protein
MVSLQIQSENAMNAAPILPAGTTEKAADLSAQLKNAQALFQKFVPPTAPSIVEELIAERRRASETE